MKITKRCIKELFRRAETAQQFKGEMLDDLGFKFNDLGCNKWVFIHKKLKWVVKIIFGWNREPKKGHPIYRFYVRPEFKGRRKFKHFKGYGQNKTGFVTLAFQLKVKVNSVKAMNIIEEKLKKLRYDWSDLHEGNVGFLNGRPVIIDF